ncbi:DUF3320 domain-containing protein [Candidatus Bathyarchaeota archaeon]|nr:MAG: DUF3320 domain-containing protein [Candidatus Bathyarchaeota archaeon]
MPKRMVDIACGKVGTPSSKNLRRLYDEASRLLQCLEKRFEGGLSWQGRRLPDVPIEDLIERIRTLQERVDDIQLWVDFKEVKFWFYKKGFKEFFDKLIEQCPPSSKLIPILRKAIFLEWIEAVYERDEALGRFRTEGHERLIRNFQELDKKLIRLSAYRVIQRVIDRRPPQVEIHAKDAEVNILRREAAKRRRLMPIRELFLRIPNLLRLLKPCLLMSPLSVSQFLSPEMRFDLVVFDEASQLLPWDAVGAIYRGKTIVVAGDNRQLPPTSFFQRVIFDERDWDELEEYEVEVFDSILDECLGIGLPVLMLKWHYRSKHEDLIAFSNHRFYDNKLITFPSPFKESEELGVELVYVEDGVYYRGTTRKNPREAEIVADLVFKHFQRYGDKKSLGVVTFSIAQMEAVEEAIEARLRKHPEFEHFFREDRLHGFFVKNLENVQGDERDVIIISVGYGRDPRGRMTMQFGPLNKEGGERRLNVLITRAREKVILVSSIKADDIDLRATKAPGVLNLYHYLRYAEAENKRKALEAVGPALPWLGEYESPLEEEVAGEIRRMGYDVIPQVGCSGYRIDLGVIDPAKPGRFILGVECDGATYHSAHNARDRDRIRQEVLERMGWKIHRIWAPSWVANRKREVERLRKAIEKAQNYRWEERQKKAEGEDRYEIIKKTKKNTGNFNNIALKQINLVERIGVPYKVSKLEAKFKEYITVYTSRWPYVVLRKNEFHMPENQRELRRLIRKLVKEEGPIHFDLVVKRLADAWGLKRVGVRAKNAVRKAMWLCKENGSILVKGEFLWPPKLRDVPIRVPVPKVPESKRRIEHIPPEEIEKAMMAIVYYAAGIGKESLISETAHVFGLRCVRRVANWLFPICEKLVREGRLISSYGKLTLSEGERLVTRLRKRSPSH